MAVKVELVINAKNNANSALGSLQTGLSKIASVAKVATVALVALGAGAVYTLGRFLSSSSKAASDFEKSMITLEILSTRFGVSADEAKDAANRLGKELRIGVGPAAEALQNLLKSGLNLQNAEELMRRLTNEAITGKSSSISLAEAVQNLSFAYATNNSALGNLSGISENFSVLTENGRAALEAEGMATEAITDDMAKFRGIMDLTNLTLGASERFTGTLTDTQATLDQQLQDIKVTVGQHFNPIMNELLQNTILPLATAVSANLEPAIQLAKEAFLKWWVEIKDKIAPKLDEMRDKFGVLIIKMQRIWEKHGPEITQAFKDFADAGVQEVVKFAGKLIDKLLEIADWMEKNPEKVNEIIATFRDFGLALMDVAGFLSDVIDKADEAVALLSDLQSNNFVSIGSKVLGMKEFAQGGEFITKGPTPIMVGEGGQQEHVKVTPLSRSSESGSSIVNLNVNIPLFMADEASKRTVAEEIWKQLKTIARGDGVALPNLTI